MKQFTILIFVLYSLVFKSNAMVISSPNKKIHVVVELRKNSNPAVGRLYLKIEYISGQMITELLPFSPLGLLRKDQKFTDNLTYIRESKIVSVHDKYEMVHGKKRNCENIGNEKTFQFMNSEGKPLDIIFRVYNNGVAFRYSFPGQSDSTFQLVDEFTAYSIPDGIRRWMQPYQISYEDYFPLNINGIDTKNQQDWGYPALYQKDSMFVLISEANISRFNCATKLSNKESFQLYKISLPSERDDYKQIGAKFTLPWKSSWRVLMIGNLASIVESTLITDLSEPCKISDTKWIEPGAVSWIYWANNHGSKDYKKVVEYVDLAVAMKWPYVLIDWEWDVMGNGGSIEDAVKYANSKGIKPLMWYNSGTAWKKPTPVDRLLTKEKRINEFKWLNRMGVYGIKVDFFAGDQQDMMNYYLDLLEDAAQFHLLVNFHGATLPRGWERTYPNLMSVEAVYGAEWYNNVPTFTDKAAAHNATLPFTRNVVGPMDYTPVTFSNSQHPHITSYGHELALSVVFESGLQHFADSPTGYLNLPDEPKSFLKAFPTAWDETRLIDGYPGEKVIIARRKGGKWYIGGINGTDSSQTLTLNSSFLKKGLHHLQLIKDGAVDKSFETINREISNDDKIEVLCLPNGGFVGIID